MKTCDHLVGIYYAVGEPEYVRVSNRESVAQAALNGCQRWLAAGLGEKYAVEMVMQLDTPEKALADKSDLFTYCPDCGERLI